MFGSRAHISAGRTCGLGVLLAASVVAVAGLAWACVPTARTAVSPVSGRGGIQVTMTGDGLPAEAVKVDIYLNEKGTGPLLKDDVPTTSSGADKAFSTQVTVPSTVGAHYLIPVPLNAANVDVGTVSGGAGPPVAVFQVTKPSLSVAPGAGVAGTNVTVSGEQLRSGTVRLHWDSAGGPQIGTAAATGANFGFTKQVTIPAGPAGDHTIVAVPLGDPSDSASAPFRVVEPAVPPARADSVGPAIVAAALTSGNGTRVVSKKGAVTLFCGQYDESGVTGECGARSVAKLKLAGARSAALNLPARRFGAQPGKPVTVGFRLGKTGMRMLKAARRVRMRGTVTARDAAGNATPAVTFSFTLKAPKAPKKARG